jgi:glycine hydroxymethyltransferase
MVDIAHIAGLVAPASTPSPMPYADIVTSTTHKTMRGPRGGLLLTNDEQIAKKINSAVFPGAAGRPAHAHHRGQGRRARRSAQAEFKTYQQQIRKNARALAAELMERGFDLVSAAADNHLMLVDLRRFNTTGRDMERLSTPFTSPPTKTRSRTTRKTLRLRAACGSVRPP